MSSQLSCDIPNNHKIVVVGASTGVGASMARQLAQNNNQVLVVARSERDLQALCSDINLRAGGSHATYLAYDLENQDFLAPEFLQKCRDKIGEIDSLVLSVGYVDDRDYGCTDPLLIRKIMTINALRPIEIMSCFARYFSEQGHGQLLAFSSIAAGAPRSRNIAYSSAKSALESWCRGLRHYLAQSDSTQNVRLSVIALGYADTSMTFGKKLLFPVVSPEEAAQRAVQAMISGESFFYYPSFWRWIILALRCLPWSIYKRLSF